MKLLQDTPHHRWNFITTVLLSLSKTRLGAKILGWVIKEASFLLPIHRIHETDSVLAFHHPRPSYPFHALIVPKRAYRSLLDLPSHDQGFFQDALTVAKFIIRRYRLDEEKYRFIINGGNVQDIPLFHIHLIGDRHE